MAAVELDRPAIVKGMVMAAVIAVPFALLGLAASDDGLGWGGWLSVLGVLLGLVIGGFFAARDQRVGAPLTNGIVAALGVYVVVQGLGIVKRLIAGDDLNWAKYASSMLLSIVAGTVGALLAAVAAGSRRPT
jgi:xanthosine utilization system XapX-like protein